MAHLNQWWRFGLPMVAGMSLLSAGLADFLFYDQVVGWTLGGFVAWLLLVLLLRNGKALLAGRRWLWGWALSLMVLGLCVSLVLEPGTIAVVLAVILLSTLAMLAHGWSSRSLGWGWLWQMGVSWMLAVARPIRDSRLARRWAKRTQGLRSRAIGVAKWVWAFAGIVIPLVLSLIFLAGCCKTLVPALRWPLPTRRPSSCVASPIPDHRFSMRSIWKTAFAPITRCGRSRRRSMRS